MKYVNLLILSLFVLTAPIVQAQILSVDPVFPTSDDTVTIIYDATQGNAALAGVSPVYVHTGLITSQSTSPSDWQYEQGTWAMTGDSILMEDLGNNLHKIRYHVRSYYELPVGEDAEEIAFVFRNADGTIVGREGNGSDIYYPLFDTVSLAAAIISPFDLSFYDPGELVPIQVSSSDSATISLFINNVLVKQVFDKEISYTDTLTAPGVRRVRAVVDNGTDTFVDSIRYFVSPPQEILALPPGMVEGVNYIDDSTVILSQYAPGKTSMVAVGDFNNWDAVPEAFMKKTPDGNRFWVEISGLIPGKEYAYLFGIDESLLITDAYAEKVLDYWNDPWIADSTYPNIKPYPVDEVGPGILAVLQTAQTPYVWQTQTFQRPNQEELVIYEMLIRDFVAAHDYKTAIDTLDYLQRMGINAIELMPIMEFEGNSSWGYDPSFFFAVDKYYGTANDLKAFIDTCHSRGIAVILDMVLNHSFGSNPLVQMYWDAANNKPAANSPWFNPDATHPFNVGYDFNHESPATQVFVDRVMEHWVNEYRFDGYRMDLSKGFTQVNFGGNVGAWSGYDASRITLLKRMADQVWANEPETYIILEHFADNSEEKELSEYGFMLWGNLVHDYNEATMGFLPNSNFEWISYQKRGWADPHVVGYMESHDEERLMYKNLNFGNSSGPYSTRDLTTALERMEQAAAFFFTIPGPKMIWQFGELGYEVSIDENGRTGEKPIRWHYQLIPERIKLYRVYSALINLRNSHEVFDTDDFEVSLEGAFKRIHLNDPTMNVTVMGNFNVSLATGSPNFQHTGMWYEFFTGDSLDVTNVSTSLALNPGEYRLYTDVKLTQPDVTLSTDEALADRIGLSLFPNPFSAEVIFAFDLNESGAVSLEILDMTGRVVSQVSDQVYGNGPREIRWNGTSGEGQPLVPGAYFYRLSIAGKTTAGKLMYQP